MYRILKIQVKQKNPLYQYFSDMTHAANNFSNTVLFYIHQVMTATQKPESEWTANERAVIKEVSDCVKYCGGKYPMPTKDNCILSDYFLKRLFVYIKNPDYYQKYLPAHAAQHIISSRVQDMKSFCKAVKDYQKRPEKYTGKPKIPHYRKSGGMCSTIISNQQCTFSYDKDHTYLKLPYTKKMLDLGKGVSGRLKQVTIVPNHGIFTVYLTLEEFYFTEDPVLIHKRICSIDVGVENIAAITNNIDEPCLLFKGNVIKSINHQYNKKMSQIMSEQTKGTTKKFVMTPEAEKICLRRNNQISDFIHKVAKQIILWCVENHIDTIIYGRNKFWKQETSMSKQNNQNFVEIPFNQFRRTLIYLAEREGIAFLEQDESYTSKADFCAFDPIPTYRKGSKKSYKFSGTRMKRGLYKNYRGELLNADLNSSANIGRKCIPDMYDSGCYPDFSNVIIIKHPDYEKSKANREKQILMNRK